MFHQIAVPEEQRDLLRFLFWKDGQPGQAVKIYRMTRHLFGGTWSSGAANFALKRTGKEFIDDYSLDVTEAVEHSFYVDDLLHSVQTKKEAISTGKGLQQMLKKRGFNLTKWGSNDKDVITAFNPEDRAKGLQSLNF